MPGRRSALVVAVDDYEHPGLRRLPSAGADADALASVLGDPAVAGFDVQVVRNQPAYEIQARIEDLFVDARADDVLLLHFSGHGLKSEAGELFFAARTTRPDRLASTAVPAEFVQRCLRSSASRSIVLLLDCCYGGAFGHGVAVRAGGDVNVVESFPGGRLGGGRGRAVISASNSMEYAFEGDQLRADAPPQPSLFTAALVRGLATGEADRDEDGWVSLNELYDYVFDRVRGQNPNQTPSRDIEMQGELYLARSGRRRVRPAQLPGDLQAALEDANPYARLGAVAELQTRLLSDNLPVAAGAHEALAAVVATDTRLVADAATQALRAVQVGVAPSVLSFAPLPAGARSAPQRLALTGPPLARAVTVSVSDPWIRVEEADGGYDVAIVSPGSAAATGSVTLGGAAGAVTIAVTVGAPQEKGEQKSEGKVPAKDLATAGSATAGSAPVPAGEPGGESAPTAAARPPAAARASIPSPTPPADVAAPPTPAPATSLAPVADEARPATSPEPATPPGPAASLAPVADEARPATGLTRGIAALAIGPGVALAVALVVQGVLDGQPLELLYALLHPGLLVVAGTFVLRPGTRMLGLGLVAGAGAAATLPVVLVGSAIQAHAVAERRWAALVLLGVVLCALAGALAAVAAAGISGAGLDRARLRRPAGLVIVAGALLGSLALVLGASTFAAAADSESSWLIPVCWWAAVPALVVPLLAGAALPDRLRAAAMWGWVLAAGGFHVLLLQTLTAQNITFSYTGFVLQLPTLLLELAGTLLAGAGAWTARPGAGGGGAGGSGAGGGAAP